MGTRDYYDAYWSPASAYLGGLLTQQLSRELENQVGEETRLLDFGCGDGKLIGRWLSRRAGSYLGLDISETAVSKAIEHGLEARRIDSETELGVSPDSFDVALAVEVLEHLFAPHEAVRELRRALAPGGILMATVPNVAYWRRRLGLGLAGRWNPAGDALSVQHPWRDPHIRFFTAATLKRMLEEAGFGEVTVSGHGGALLGDLPLLSRLARRRGSSLYRRLESASPSILGARLLAVASKPQGASR